MQTRVFKVSVGGVGISGISFQNCNPETSADGGGAIFIGNSCYRFELTDCSFTNCRGQLGGAVASSIHYNEHDAQTTGVFPPRGNMGVISGCDFANCAATGTEAGGGAVAGAFWIENSTFTNCEAERYAAIIHAGAHLMVTNCTFSDCRRKATSTNRAAVWQSKGNCENRIVDCSFTHMACGPLAGSDSKNMVVLDRCDINDCAGEYDETCADNTNYRYSLFRNSNGTLRNSLVHGNQNPLILDGGSVENCTIVDNVGGFFLPFRGNGTYPTIGLTNCLFYGNSVWDNGNYKSRGGPGLCWHQNAADVDVYKGIAMANCAFQGAYYNASFNVLMGQDVTGESTRIAGLLDQKGPGFVDADNGNYRLTKRSVLIDQGLKTDSIALGTDLAGSPRCFTVGKVENAPEALPDIGCFEYYNPIKPFTIRIR